MNTFLSYYRLGPNWEEGIYISQELKEAQDLLPYKESTVFDISKWRDDSGTVVELNCTEENIISDTEETHTCTCEINVINMTNTSSPSSSRQEKTCICKTEGKVFFVSAEKFLL